MKKSLTVLLLGIVAYLLLGQFQESISRFVVHHKEAGNFINTEDIKTDKITMLHWFGRDVQIYSEEEQPLQFLIINPGNQLNVFINRLLVLQNESVDYPMYQTGNFVLFNIDDSDYKEYRSNIYVESKKNSVDRRFHESGYFVDDQYGVTGVAIVYTSFKILTLVFMCVVAMLLYMLQPHKKISVFMVLAVLVYAVSMERGIFFIILFLGYLGQSSKTNLSWTFGHIALAFVLPTWTLWIYLGAMLLYTLWQTKNTKKVCSLVTLIFMIIILSLDMEFSIFKIIRGELIMLIFTVNLIIRIVQVQKKSGSRKDHIDVSLLRSINHDLRVPLSTIQLNTELLSSDDFTAGLNREKVILTIKTAIGDLNKMISSLSAYLSMENFVHRRYNTCIQDSIEHTVSYFDNNEKNIIIDTLLCSEPLYLHIEKTWLNRLLYNLLENAYKYTEDYGEIKVILKKVKKHKIIIVKDNGIGMGEEELQKIMKPFYRVDASRSISGFGLGLSIVKTIVDKMNGDIQWTSMLGVGTEVKIQI